MRSPCLYCGKAECDDIICDDEERGLHHVDYPCPVCGDGKTCGLGYVGTRKCARCDGMGWVYEVTEVKDGENKD